MLIAPSTGGRFVLGARPRAKRLTSSVSTIAVFGLGLLLVSCSSPEPSDHSNTSRSSSTCGVNAMLVPECGVLLGVTSPTPDAVSLATSEAALSRSVDFVYRFHWLEDDFPTAEERQLLDQGRMLHYSLDTDFKDPSSPYYLSWSEVADGAVDDRLREIAQGVASLPDPVWMTFEHEADQQDRDWQGSGADFIEAWRHVQSIFDEEGATNAVWTWVVMGTPVRFDRAAEVWPGNDAVDWISWEAYDAAGCRSGGFNESQAVTFAQAFGEFHHWYRTQGRALGMSQDLPIMISESGSSRRPGREEERAAWYAAIPDVLKDHPDVKAIGLWDHTGNSACDYRFDSTPLFTEMLASRMSRDALGLSGSR